MAGGRKVAILGAGSVGCFIGGAWASAGLDVTLIGRPKISADVDEHGLTVSDYTGWQAHLPPGDVDYRCGPEALDEAEIIVLTVKSGDTAEAAAQILCLPFYHDLTVADQKRVVDVIRSGEVSTVLPAAVGQ